MPVLPEVGSTIVPPGFKAPLRSAASIIDNAMRSLIEPPGLARSDLIHTSRSGPNRRLMRMCGVWPIVSRMLAAFKRLLRTGVREIIARVKRARPPLVHGAERPHWRKVRTAQGSAGGNASPPQGANQSHRDESLRGESIGGGETRQSLRAATPNRPAMR